MAIDGPLTIDREAGKAPGTLIIRLTGPLTLRNMFELQDQIHSTEPVPLTVLDLTHVPYMDSAGMGLIINYYVHCQKIGVRFVVAGISPRVMELFKMTHVDTVIEIAPTAEQAEALA